MRQLGKQLLRIGIRFLVMANGRWSKLDSMSVQLVDKFLTTLELGMRLARMEEIHLLFAAPSPILQALANREAE